MKCYQCNVNMNLMLSTWQFLLAVYNTTNSIISTHFITATIYILHEAFRFPNHLYIASNIVEYLIISYRRRDKIVLGRDKLEKPKSLDRNKKSNIYATGTNKVESKFVSAIREACWRLIGHTHTPTVNTLWPIYQISRSLSCCDSVFEKAPSSYYI